ncbi:SpnB-like Rossmann fold domain-containing protein, partial [Saccharomonospora iraqiensis]|uniref:SpnB-like Rossmann fold domain-containing protein n=1 Tax=Saccharomonospora iraqiensis TaxID=52698 RepID=UPI0005946116
AAPTAPRPLFEVRWETVDLAPAEGAVSRASLTDALDRLDDGPAVLAVPGTDVAAMLVLLQRLVATEDVHLVVETHGTGSPAGADDLVGAAVQGLVRTAQSEHPGRITLVDAAEPTDVAAAAA